MTVRVGILTLKLYLPLSHSLKEKRKVVNRVKDRIANKFNVSIAEINSQDKWQILDFAIVLVGTNITFMEKSLQQISTFVEKIIAGEAEIVFEEISYL